MEVLVKVQLLMDQLCREDEKLRHEITKERAAPVEVAMDVQPSPTMDVPADSFFLPNQLPDATMWMASAFVRNETLPIPSQFTANPPPLNHEVPLFEPAQNSNYNPDLFNPQTTAFQATPHGRSGFQADAMNGNLQFPEVTMADDFMNFPPEVPPAARQTAPSLAWTNAPSNQPYPHQVALIPESVS